MPENIPRILAMIDWYLPGYRAGGPIQSVNNLVQAMRNRFAIKVITTDTDHACSDPYEGIEGDSWNQLADGTEVFYYTQQGLKLSALEDLLKQEAFDFLYLNSMYSVPFTMWPLWLCWRNRLPGKVVLAPRGMLQAGAVQIKWAKKRLYLFLMSLTGIQKRIIWHATDETEAQDIQRYFGTDCDIRLAPNLPRQDQMPWLEVPKSSGEAHFVFSSRVSRKKNIEFFLQRLHGIRGKVTFDIFGPQEDESYLDQCKEEVQKLPDTIQVRFHGALPSSELQQKLRTYHISVLTTHAENFGHAIFEGMLAGKPVLISDRTPWRGLSASKAGWDLSLSTPEAFEQIIQEIVDMDQPTYNIWSQSAWEYARKFRTDPELIKQVNQVFQAKKT
ncbi:MAG: glycosyltransferase [Bacteroidota bacterium]